MAALTMPLHEFNAPVPPAFTGFDVIAGEGALPRSRELLEEYFDLRDVAQTVDKIEGEELNAVQEDVRSWAEEAGFLDIPETLEERKTFYTTFSEQTVQEKILGLVDYLEQNHADKVSHIELEATRAFVEATFANYNDRPKHGVAPDADGSHAFLVPIRTGRDHEKYGPEMEQSIPAFRYLPNQLRAQMLIGLPPFVIDTYAPQNGKQGYLMFVPVSEDMRHDLGQSVSLQSKAINQNINAAVDFAYERFGVTHVGLGASLPSYTRFGQKITNEHVTVTTGHGGTIALINKIVADTLEKTLPEANGKADSIAVLGLGAIGMRIAEITAQQNPDAKIHVYDPNAKLVGRALALASNIVAAGNEVDAIMASQATISAIAGKSSKLDLEAFGIDNLEGRVIIDDSQPGSVDPLQAEKLGGAVVWVIGSDSMGKIVRRGYDYATMHDSHTDLFGCEAEVASQALYEAELRERGMTEDVISSIMSKIAVREAVTAQKVRYTSALFTKFGIHPSRPQAFGRPVRIPPVAAA